MGDNSQCANGAYVQCSCHFCYLPNWCIVHLPNKMASVPRLRRGYVPWTIYAMSNYFTKSKNSRCKMTVQSIDICQVYPFLMTEQQNLMLDIRKVTRTQKIDMQSIWRRSKVPQIYAHPHSQIYIHTFSREMLTTASTSAPLLLSHFPF